jgi:ribosomal protein L12E/L44/L45/RPP1/RPP2
MLSLIVWAAALFSVGCAPSKSTIAKLHSAANIVVQQIDVNVTLPDQLLAEKIITVDQLETVRKYITMARAGAAKAEQFLAQAMTLEKPSLKALAPIIADVILQLRGLTTLVNNEKVQRFFASVEFGLRVLGSYFALQVSRIKSELRDSPFGVPTDAAICKALGIRYDKTRFDLLSTAYDGRRFDEYAAALP